MTCPIHVSEEDYIRFNEFHMMHSKQGKSTLMSLRILFPLMAILILIAICFGNNDRTYLWICGILFLIMTVAWEIFIPKFLAHSVRKSILKLKKSGKLPYMVDSELSWNDTEISAVSDIQSVKLPLDNDLQTFDTGDFLYLYFGSSQAIIIPSRDLGTEKEALSAILKEKTQFVECK